MKMTSLLRCWRAWVFLVGVFASATAFGAAKQLWTAKLPGDAKWHSRTALGTLVVGTSDAILAFDPDTGQQVWTRSEFKKTSPFSAREIPGTPVLVCNTAEGFAGQKVTLFVIDYLTGKTFWQTPEMQGQFLGTIPLAEKGLVLFLINGMGADNKEPGTYLHALDLADGKAK